MENRIKHVKNIEARKQACRSKYVDVSIKAWKITNPSIQAYEGIDIDIGIGA